MKFIFNCLAIFFILFIFLLVIVFVYNNPVKPSKPVVVPGQVAGKTSTPSGIFNLTDVVDYDNRRFAIMSVHTIANSDYDRLKTGYEFTIVNLRIQNRSNITINYNCYDFMAQDKTGVLTNSTFTTFDQKTAMSNGALAPNGNTTGTLAFETPKGDKTLLLCYVKPLETTPCVCIKLF